MFNYRGQSFLEAPEGAPAIEIGGRRVYPVVVDQHPRLLSFVWRFFVEKRLSCRADNLAKLLWSAGIGTRVWAGKGRDQRMSEETAREALREVICNYSLPVIYDGREYRLARDRAELNDYLRSLQARIDEMQASLDGVRAAHLGLPEQVSVEGFADEEVAAYLDLIEAGWVKDREAAARLGAGWSDSRLRKLRAGLRRAGLAIVSHTHSGSTLITKAEHKQGWVESQERRIRRIRERGLHLREARARWFPASAEERAAFCSGIVRPFPPTEQRRERVQNTNERAERRKAKQVRMGGYKSGRRRGRYPRRRSGLSLC